MPLRDGLRRLAYQIRAIPGELGVRPYSVAIVRRVSSGQHTGDGTQTDTVTAITEHGGQPPKVRWLSNEQRAVQGVEAGTVEIGPITPDTATTGTPLSSIRAWQSKGDEVYVRLTGPRWPNGVLCRIHGLTHDRAFRWVVQAVPIEEDLP